MSLLCLNYLIRETWINLKVLREHRVVGDPWSRGPPYNSTCTFFGRVKGTLVYRGGFPFFRSSPLISSLLSSMEYRFVISTAAPFDSRRDNSSRFDSLKRMGQTSSDVKEFLCFALQGLSWHVSDCFFFSRAKLLDWDYTGECKLNFQRRITEQRLLRMFYMLKNVWC